MHLLTLDNVIENPRPYKIENIIYNWLIYCKNEYDYWNRDVNGETHIYKIAYNMINNKELPNYLSRRNHSYKLIRVFIRMYKIKIYMHWNRQILKLKEMCGFKSSIAFYLYCL